MRSPDQLVASFRASGRKVTPQREGIFRVLHENPTHPTAEAVHARIVSDMPSVSLRTVYATLHELAEMGELQQLELGTGSARFDPNVEEHHHLVCERCGAVQDVDARFPDVSLPADNEFDFAVGSTEIVFRGTCGGCQTTSPSNQ
ncbi:Fur family transcriptional regulator [Actinospongicola halichondriae]|uniref:Fur family transcriptional regulator n=1 Tax=Actinospongicola halichondriae TaxID=3236844 RepID=UPI003D42F176